MFCYCKTPGFCSHWSQKIPLFSLLMSSLAASAAVPLVSPEAITASSASDSTGPTEGTEQSAALAKKRKGGRPAKALVEKLTSVTMYVSPKDYDWLVAGARVMRQTVSEFARGFIESKMGRRITPPPRLELTQKQDQALTKLAGAVNNLNQLARVANREGFAAAAQQVEQVRDELRALLSELAK